MDGPVVQWDKRSNDMGHAKGWLLCVFFTTQKSHSL